MRKSVLVLAIVAAMSVQAQPDVLNGENQAGTRLGPLRPAPGSGNIGAEGLHRVWVPDGVESGVDHVCYTNLLVDLQGHTSSGDIVCQGETSGTIKIRTLFDWGIPTSYIEVDVKMFQAIRSNPFGIDRVRVSSVGTMVERDTKNLEEACTLAGIQGPEQTIALGEDDFIVGSRVANLVLEGGIYNGNCHYTYFDQSAGEFVSESGDVHDLDATCAFLGNPEPCTGGTTTEVVPREVSLRCQGMSYNETTAAGIWSSGSAFLCDGYTGDQDVGNVPQRGAESLPQIQLFVQALGME